MPNANKAKGDAFEREIMEWLRAHGFPYAERTRAGRLEDQGDIHLRSGVGIAPGVIVQAKKVKRPEWTKWLEQVCRQRDAARADHGALVVKRWGVADPGQQLVVMTVAEWAQIMRQLGYGQSAGPSGADALDRVRAVWDKYGSPADEPDFTPEFDMSFQED